MNTLIKKVLNLGNIRMTNISTTNGLFIEINEIDIFPFGITKVFDSRFLLKLRLVLNFENQTEPNSQSATQT
jgi:hypothetical protein